MQISQVSEAGRPASRAMMYPDGVVMGKVLLEEDNMSDTSAGCGMVTHWPSQGIVRTPSAFSSSWR